MSGEPYTEADYTGPSAPKIQCSVLIPGVGQCEVLIGQHKQDSLGRLVHVKGACSWNGGTTIDVDDYELAKAAKRNVVKWLEPETQTWHATRDCPLLQIQAAPYTVDAPYTEVPACPVCVHEEHAV